MGKYNARMDGTFQTDQGDDATPSTFECEGEVDVGCGELPIMAVWDAEMNDVCEVYLLNNDGYRSDISVWSLLDSSQIYAISSEMEDKFNVYQENYRKDLEDGLI